MRHIIKALAILAFSGTAAIAHADKGGIYVDVGIGAALQTCDVCGADVDVGFGGKYAAGYRFGKFVAVEAGYANGGGTWQSSGTKAEESTDTIFVAVVGIIPIGEDFEVFGRLGAGKSNSVSIIGDMRLTSRSEIDTIYGFGAGYTLPGTGATVRLEYNHLSSDTSLDGGSSGISGPDGLSLVSLGIVFDF